MTRPQGESRRLLVNFTPEELEAKGGELAHAVREEDDYRAGFDAWKEDVKSTKKLKEATLRGLHLTASLLAEVVSLGREERDVPCSWLYALPQGYAFLVRDDSGEMVSHRRLDDDERQTDLTEVLREPTPEQLEAWMRGLIVDESEPGETEDSEEVLEMASAGVIGRDEEF